MGVILYAMCCNRLPFSVSDFQQNKDIVLEIPSHISEGLGKEGKGEKRKREDDKVGVLLLLLFFVSYHPPQ